MPVRVRIAAVLLACAAASARADGEGAPPLIADITPAAVIREFLYEGVVTTPIALWCDHRQGETFVADRSENLIGVFDAEGAPLFAFGDDRLHEPRAVTVDAEGRVYVLDNDAEHVKVFNYRGEFLSFLEVPGQARPPAFTAIGLDASGDLYLGDSRNGEVLVLDRERRVRLRLRSGEARPFSAITGIAFHQGQVYVADSAGVAVQVFDRVGRFVLGFGYHQAGKDGVSLPHGVAVDSKGRVVLVDTLRQELKVYQPDGSLNGIFGGLGPWPGAVRFPSAACIDAAGRLWVADSGNHRVQILSAVERDPAADEIARRARARASAEPLPAPPPPASPSSAR